MHVVVPGCAVCMSGDSSGRAAVGACLSDRRPSPQGRVVPVRSGGVRDRFGGVGVDGDGPISCVDVDDGWSPGRHLVGGDDGVADE